MMSFSLPTWLQTVHHDGSEKYLSNLYPRLGETVHIRLRVGVNAPVRQAYLRTSPDGEQILRPMAPGQSEPPARWWEIDLVIAEPVVNYRFVLEADDGVWWYSAAGPAVHIPTDAHDFRVLADTTPPPWLQDAVFYQIFPDRFANGDPTNAPRPEEFEYRGYRPQTFAWEETPPEDFPFTITFYGGDLPGIVQHLDYIAGLGVNGLYLNPIFTAPSSHKYDVSDYGHVDPHFGGDEALVALRRALDMRGMRYILDVVPNHCGYWHPWFQTARENPDAPEAEFFTFNHHPDDYTAWLGIWMLPKLNYRSAELRRRIYESDDAIFRRWLRPPYSVDGWRVDVGNMLGRQGAAQMGQEIVQGIRRAVKATRPDAYLMAENFFDATPQLQGDQWDGVMNYLGLTLPLWHWLRGLEMGSSVLKEPITSPAPWPTTALEATWRGVRAAIPWAMALQQFNVIDSHDVSRIRAVVNGNDALHRLAAVVQMTYPGVPSLYYGDEIGMVDVPRQGSRGCMIWDESRWDRDLLAFYRDIIGLRRRSSILQRGGFQVLAVEPDTLAYQREDGGGRIIVVAHRSVEPRPAGALPVAHGGAPEGTHFVEHFSGHEVIVHEGALLLPEHPQGATVWEETRDVRVV